MKTSQTTHYKGYLITVAPQSHCATIYKGGQIFKMIAGDIFANGKHNAVQKAKAFIDASHNKCSTIGCKNEAKWEVTAKLPGYPVQKCCDKCKPDINNRPEHLRDLPNFYTVKKLNS